MLNIQVSWECVTDGKAREGANFKHLMEQLLASGYQLDIKIPNGKRSFTSEEEFETWFDAIAC